MSADQIADFAEAERRASLVDGTAFEISVVVSPVMPYIRELQAEAVRIAAYGFRAQIIGSQYFDPVSNKPLVAVPVSDITPAYQGSNRDPMQFGAAFRVGILRGD
jgi:hypothetical protein